MTRKQIQDSFTKYTPLLHKMSHACSLRCGRPEHEVFQEACFHFVNASETYNPFKSEASFASYAMVVVRNNIAQWGMKNPLAVDPELIPEVTAPMFQQPDKSLMRKEWLADLSDECREVAMIILNGPGEVLELGEGAGRKVVLGALRRYLRAEKGWTWKRIWDAIRETKKEVRAI